MTIEAAPIVVDPSGNLYANSHHQIYSLHVQDRTLTSLFIVALEMMELGQPS